MLDRSSSKTKFKCFSASYISKDAMKEAGCKRISTTNAVNDMKLIITTFIVIICCADSTGPAIVGGTDAVAEGCELANFVGMLTDSRSFLSYTRHEYFRRILCELIGGWVENGEYPADYKTLKEIVCGIAYNNAVSYFGFDL